MTQPKRAAKELEEVKGNLEECENNEEQSE
jgi:hypothetical protein